MNLKPTRDHPPYIAVRPEVIAEIIGAMKPGAAYSTTSLYQAYCSTIRPPEAPVFINVFSRALRATGLVHYKTNDHSGYYLPGELPSPITSPLVSER